MTVIEIDNLSKKYKDSNYFSLKNFSLSIKENQIFGILGPNGAGKTTLISILCGLIQPTEGNFSLLNLNFKNNSNQLKQLIGVVPQEYALYQTLTAEENLLYFGSMYGIQNNVLKNKVDEYLKIMGLYDFKDKKIENFSGGMKRRINLLAGVLHEPKILFLDEPTVGVDVQSKKVIIEFLHYLNKNNTTIIYTSHHLSEAQELCDTIAIIDNGQLIAKNTPKTLIESVEEARNLEDVFIHLTGNTLRDYV